MLHYYLRVFDEKIFFFLFIFLISLNVFHKTFYKSQSNTKQTFLVLPGVDLDKISILLEEKEIIENKLLFKIWVKLSNLEKKLRFGEYLIHESISIRDLTKILVEGKSINRYLTIPEGISKYELIQLLKKIDKKFNINSFNEISDLILADTYSYNFFDGAESIIKNISQKSYSRIKHLWDKKKDYIPLNSISELLIISSIIEKETGKKSEKNKIAGVFYNRLNSNMRLQSDPTVVYALRMGKNLNRKLLRKDLKIDSEYNTYRNKGLPPGPISIPGIESVKAALNPYMSNFFYFVADKKGGHLFSENYSEHLRNIEFVKKQVY